MITFKQTLVNISSDIKFHGGTSAVRKLYTYFTNNSFRLILNYRIGHYLFSNARDNSLLKVFEKRYTYRQLLKRNCYISYRAIIGQNIFFPHPIGLVIGEGVKIGNNAEIYQNVTFGTGAKEKVGKYPIVCNNVKIYSGAVIIGDVVLNDNTVVGALSMVNKSVPEGVTVVGIPAKQINK